MNVSPLRRQPTQNSRQVVACVDQTPHSRVVADAAAGLALALDLPLTLFHVIEPSDGLRQRPDPLEWNLRRRQARDYLADLRARLSLPPDTVSVDFAEGESMTAICDRAAKPGSILVMGVNGDHESAFFRGRNVRQILEAGLAPVLLIPKDFAASKARFGRILVPLDGSHFADIALAEATRIARKTGAELLLAHVISEPQIMAFGIPESADIELHERLDQHNLAAASGLLAQAARSVAQQGLASRSVCLRGEPRSTLLKTIIESNPSLVVLSARGQGGRQCRDLPIGGTATYLLDHLVVPILFVPTQAQQIQPITLMPGRSSSASTQVA